MDWREKLAWVGICLAVISWGLVIPEASSVLAARVPMRNWTTLALLHSAASLALIGAYASTSKRTPTRVQVVGGTLLVIVSWGADFTLMGKIGTGAAKLLVLDEQWSEEKAAADCESQSREGSSTCTVNPVTAIRDSVAQIARAFRVDPACRGITLVTLNVSDNPRQLASIGTRWLFLELSRDGDPAKRFFALSRTNEPQANPVTGNGEVRFIAEISCKFVKGGISAH